MPVGLIRFHCGFGSLFCKQLVWVLCHVSSWCSSLDFLRTPGAKQHNGLIARNDQFSGHRLSVTVMTSSWSDGRRGPLGICFPKGMLKATKVEEWNEKHRGRAYLFSSEKRTHFMSGETWVLLQQKLFGDAFAMQRKVHKLSQSVEGLILADAWTGYHSFILHGVEWSQGFVVEDQPGPPTFRTTRRLVKQLSTGRPTASHLQSKDGSVRLFRRSLRSGFVGQKAVPWDVNSTQRASGASCAANGNSGRPNIGSVGVYATCSAMVAFIFCSSKPL